MNNNIKISSEKSFGIVFTVFFIIVTLYYKLFYDQFNILTTLMALTCLIITFSKPILFKYPNIAWFYFGIFLGKIFIPIFLGFTYFVIFTTTGFLVKIFKKNYIDKNIDHNKSSYWIRRERKIGSFDDQF